MNLASYGDALELAGSWVGQPIPYAIPTQSIRSVNVRVGIYIACRSDMDTLYVGSAVRPLHHNGVARRIYEHPVKRRSTWWWYWIVPLINDTPRDAVLAIEGLIIDMLRPPMNDRRHRRLSMAARPRT
jgi:hypothetical protein